MRVWKCTAILGQLFKGASGAAAGTGAASEPQPELEPEFQTWLRGQGITTQPLVLRQCGREGRGLVADRPLARGEALLQLPDDLLLTPQRAAEGPSGLTTSRQRQGTPEHTN
ncbi:hypothetical protein HXX76_000428 [Chlamydomonas incerta]|uniref:Uncharacterized protein n=1 Tax=Chlamydomonas incerta TaxID=51695 RepID=A0A836B306_CHLIN|nr:hypothetical protein HXX76_000428 [Chlamydomonas incerta]|eukprot:KAG2445824.1 hypothetical protein HXX76_000428 [Chlamydomonas incerta]